MAVTLASSDVANSDAVRRVLAAWSGVLRLSPIPVSRRQIIEGTVDLADPRREAIMAALRSIGSVRCNETDTYEPEELTSSTLLLITTGCIESLRFVADSFCEPSDACDVCHIGGFQTTPLQVAGEWPDVLQDRSVFGTTRLLFLRRHVATEVRLAAPSGPRLLPLLGTGDDPEWWQLVATATMPPMLREASRLVQQRPCRACGRNGYFNDAGRDFRPTYSTAARGSLVGHEVMETFEHAGQARLAPPWLLLAPRIWSILERADAGAVRAIPVRFEHTPSSTTV